MSDSDTERPDTERPDTERPDTDHAERPDKRRRRRVKSRGRSKRAARQRNARQQRIRPATFSDKLREFLYAPPVEVFIYTMIIISVSMLSLEVGGFGVYVEHKQVFDIAEIAFMVVFTVEYVLKFAVAKQRWLFFRQNIIDLLAILPFMRYFRLLRGVRILRLLRVVRLLRLGNMVARRVAMLEGMKNYREVMIVVVVFLATVLSGSIGILLFERGAPDSGFNNLGDGLWWCIVTITTVGYGDISPTTPAGKILGGVIMLVGLSFYGLIAGLGSTFIITRLKKGSQWMLSTFSRHTVILGVNDKLHGVVTILLEQGKQVAIITDDIDRVLQYPENKVAIIEGDFLQPRFLHQARVETAATAIILSDTHDRSPVDADARAVLATLAIEQIKSDIITVVEVNTQNAAFHLENAGVDEIIITGGMTAEMLAYSTDRAGFSEHLGILMRFCHRNKITTAPCPARFSDGGKKLSECIAAYALERKILIGVRVPDGDGKRNTLAPDHVMTADDELVYIEIV